MDVRSTGFRDLDFPFSHWLKTKPEINICWTLFHVSDLEINTLIGLPQSESQLFTDQENN